MKILAIDTSSKNATVAITENEKKLIELNNSNEKTHSQKLMPMIDEVFKKTNLSLDDIELIVCGLGPGSFTGVRIGIATAKAFADSRNIPCVGVNSLEELAYNLNTEGNICALIDAGHENVYAGFFEIEKNTDNKLQIIKEDLTFLTLKYENNKISEKKLLDFLSKNLQNSNQNKTIYFVDDATENYTDLFQKLKENNIYEIKLSSHNQNILSGITVAQLGYTKYKNGQYGSSNILSPVYLRKSQAELALEEKNKK